MAHTAATQNRLIRLAASLISLLLLIPLASCGSSGEQDTAQSNDSPNNSSNSTNTDDSDSGNTEKKNDGESTDGTDTVLITYFSKTGTTEGVAKQIQQLTGGTLFRIETQKPYPEDYDQTVDQAQQERNNNARPALKETQPRDFSKYTTVFVGYPIWWGDAPMAVLNFLESNDFQGKKVVPFCTSGGSGLEGSLAKVQEAARGATFLKGKRITDTDEVEPWLKEIGILN